MVKIILKHKREVAVKRLHPWIFSGAVYEVDGNVVDGDVVEVYSSKGEYLATGHYQDGSIKVRLFSFDNEQPDLAFWKRKLEAARVYRKQIGLPKPSNTNCYRLIHAEGDGLPGLIIDIYGKTAVVQCHSIGMHRLKEKICQALIEIFGNDLGAVYDKSAETLPSKYAEEVTNGYLFGKAPEQEVLENGHRFFVNWEIGQKTGFFLDQRDNRQFLTKYVEQKKVLNAFCYSGGFSIYALKSGATLVHSVDVSKKAIEWTLKNANINECSIERHAAYAEDVLKFLQKTEEEYEVMVVDPPAFAKSQKKRHNAVQGYKRLNALAMKKIAPGGILFTFSCSQVINRQLFYDTMVAAAIEAGRQVKVMHHLSQPADHPVNLFHPEGAYLKGLVLFVE